MKKKTNLQFKRFGFFWLYTFFALVIPIILINSKYRLYYRLVHQKPTVIDLTIAGMVALIIILFFLRNHINNMIDDMEDCTTKTIYKEIMRVTPLFLLFFALKYAELHIKNYQWIVWWSACSNLIAVIPRIKQINYRKQVNDMKLAGRLKKYEEPKTN